MSFLATIIMMFCVNIIKITGECPSMCECKWKSGKESVLCINSNMTEIPKHLDSGTQLLDLTGNNFVKIREDEFSNANLLNLQKIFMPKCKLRTIDRFSFRHIKNLVELDLSYNELQTIPSHTFEFITELRELRLNGNPIVRVSNNSFKTVPHLTRLELSECKIAFVEVKAFQGIENSLQWLNLDKNKISNIKSQALKPLKNLHGLELSNNPWNCTCGLRPLREWILDIKLPYRIPPACKYPQRLSGKDWDKLDLDEFSCVPKIEAVNSNTAGEEGNNITISCILNANTPAGLSPSDYTVRWLRKDHLISNYSNVAGTKKLYIIEIANSQTNLTIIAADVQDSGVYVCRAENKAGKSEANLNLLVTMKPVEKVWSSRVIIASAAVIVLFILATVLLIICACSLRKRHHRFHHTGVTQGRTDSYEMNHKQVNNSYDKVIKYGNNYSTSVKTDLSAMQGNQNKTRNGKYRGVPDSDLTEDESGYENGCTTLTPISAERESRIWSSLRLSDGDDQLSESSDRRLSPDLHIPRMNRTEVLRPMQGNLKKGIFDPIDNLDPAKAYKSNPSELLTSTPGVKSHIMHKQILSGNGGTLYTTALPESDKVYQESASKYPDLLELSLNDKNVINNNNSFCTLPRKRSYKAKRPRHSSCGSESQSPLLPGSSGDSCDSNYSINRRLSMESSVPIKNTSLPTSPRNLTPSTILSLLDNSSDLYKNLSPNIFEYKSSELEKFLKEYRNLQEQLYKMKESCENLKEDNLKFNSGAERSRSVENSTISRLIDPVYSVNEVYSTTEIEPLYSVTQQLLNDTNNLDSVYSGNKLLLEPEDNNNPKSILKNKTCDQKTVLDNLDYKNDTYWMSRNKLLNSFTDPNRGNDFYES